MKLPLSTLSQIFAHAMTAKLQCHAHNFVAVTWSQLGWNQNEIYTKFELRLKTTTEMGPKSSNSDIVITTQFCIQHRCAVVPFAQFFYQTDCQKLINSKTFFCRTSSRTKFFHFYPLCYIFLTLKHRETHGCVVSTVATDALVLKHQTISILSTD